MREFARIPEWLSDSKPWPLSWLAHYTVAVCGGVIIGFIPEAFIGQTYYNTALEPLTPVIAFCALLLGYLLGSSVFKGRAATFVWVIGAAWLGFGMYDSTRYWSPAWSPEKTVIGYMVANLFTTHCGGTECLGELLFTTPFVCSVMYSVGACVSRHRAANHHE